MQVEGLILQLKKQNEVAFSQTYDRYSIHVFEIITNTVKDVEIAEEVLRDAFIKIWNKSDFYSSGKRHFFVWLLNIYKDVAIDK
jgi:RNA polymerase sigma-70 factor (ECF subfamily)